MNTGKDRQKTDGAIRVSLCASVAAGGSPQVVVVGAGAFGGWTALALRRRGAAVTLVDAGGPGHPRASSGGDTRVIRASYGSRPNYTRMAARALIKWREWEAAWPGVFRTTGVLWMLSGHEAFGRASADALADEGLRMNDVPLADARRRYPQIDFSGVDRVLFEPAAGYLRARDACARVVDALRDAGGTYLTATVRSPFDMGAARSPTVRLLDGTAIRADAVVLACGPWLGTLLPGVIGALVAPTRQEVYYFGTPAGDDRFTHDRLPVWLGTSASVRSMAFRGRPRADSSSPTIHPVRRLIPRPAIVRRRPRAWLPPPLFCRGDSPGSRARRLWPPRSARNQEHA